MSKIAVIFGGNGFIGSHLAKTLLASGEYDRIVSVDIAQKPRLSLDGIEYLSCDVRQPIPADLVPGATEIYNLAAVHTTPGHEDHEYYQTNVLGAAHVCAFARDNRVATLVFTSSISVYGPGEEAKSEQTPPAPKSAYGWSKLLAEDIHRTWLSESTERRLIIVRPAVIFGPHERGNFTRLARMLQRGFFVYPGRADTIKACFYVDDLIEAIRFSLDRQEQTILFNGCYPDRFTISDIVNTMRRVHFAHARTFVFPRQLILALAKLLQPLSASGLGIHPDRILKLIRSTDIAPGWLAVQGHASPGRLTSAIERWKTATGGHFD